MKQAETSLYDQKLVQIRHDYELRFRIRIIVTSIGVLVSMFALISILGFISHAEWANLSGVSTSSLSERLTQDIFQSGYMGMGIFSGFALLMWGVRTRV